MIAHCQTCEGNGELQICDPRCDGSHVGDVETRCPDCHGSGMLHFDRITGCKPPTDRNTLGRVGGAA